MEQINRLASELAEMLRTKKQYLLGTLNFTQLQSSAIDDKDDEKLHEYIDEKQKIIDKINDLDMDFVVKFSSLKSMLGVDSLDELTGLGLAPLKQIRFELDGIHMLIEQIFTTEKENSVKLKVEFDDIKTKLREISGGKKVVSAYGAKPNSSGGAFFDTKK